MWMRGCGKKENGQKGCSEVDPAGANRCWQGFLCHLHGPRVRHHAGASRRPNLLLRSDVMAVPPVLDDRARFACSSVVVRCMTACVRVSAQSPRSSPLSFADSASNAHAAVARRLTVGAPPGVQVPQLEEPIDYRDGLIVVGNTAAGIPVTPELVELLRDMIRRMNDASRDLPQLHPCTTMGCAGAAA